MTPIPLPHILIFSTLLFLIGLYGVLTRRNVVGILISIEIMLNAANINFIAFARALNVPAEIGVLFVIFVIVMAAVTAAVGLAIVLSLYRTRKTIYMDEVDFLKW